MRICGLRLRRVPACWSAALVAALPLAAAQAPALHRGYYTSPAIHGDMIVFTSEGDLWTVTTQGGVAHRLTSDPGREDHAAISPDGKTVAFNSDFEGPDEVYTMPIEGGIPERRTWDGEVALDGWSPDGRLLVATGRYATLPEAELVLIDSHGARERLPLAQAAEGAYSSDGRTLFFTRWFKQPSETKRYKGGTAENIWRFDGSGEAAPLTADWAGASTNPMFWNGRVYFLSDRDGVMNVYSIDEQGHGLKEESRQRGFDIESASIDDGRIVYACGSDLWLLDLKSGQEQAIPVTLASDFDQMREHWVKKPLDYLTNVHLSPDGGSAVFTTRGEVFVLPAKTGRIVKAAAEPDVRYRDARFTPDGKSILVISTASGETEFWKYPANGEGAPEQWTHDSRVQEDEGIVSPDGRWLAHHDHDQQLWIYDTKARTDKRIGQSLSGDYQDLAWSADSQWLAYAEPAENQFFEIKILNVGTGAIQAITDDRYNSLNPAWSADGKWLYFLSDRMLKTTIGSPWGPREPEPHFDRTMKVYELPLTPGLRSPFLPADELHPDKRDGDQKEDEKKDEEKPADDGKGKSAKSDAAGNKSDDKEKSEAGKTGEKKDEKKPPEVKIDFNGIAARLEEVPVPAGNFMSLQATEKRLCWLDASDDRREHQSLECVDIDNKGDAPDTVLAEVKGYEISEDRKKLLVRKGDDFLVLDSDVKGAALGDPKALGKATIDLSHWTFAVTPREEFRGIFLDAWRMERDYFYDAHMQGVDWNGMRDRYLPLVERVADRDELNTVIAQMVSELSALHTFVAGGDERAPADHVELATLGARLRRDEKAGGYVVEHIYAHDPDLPDQAPPLARPDSLVKEGETIVSIDGRSTLSAPDERALLYGKAGVQVMLTVQSEKGEKRDVLVKPMGARDDERMRYAEWEYTRREKVEADSKGTIGYVHLQAMGSGDMDEWARDFYPVYRRQGLIIDVRHNGGGNIDSWLLSKLLRQAWFYWQPRVGNPDWNMQDAFRGHIVVLCDEMTMSDGEAFSEGFKRLKLGTLIGTRTWGGEIWLSGDNVQQDNGIATAAELGVYGPDGKWLIEGHGVDPDVVVDNLPHATYAGGDAQLDAAVKMLEQEIKDDPRPIPPHPPYPDKSFRYTR
jgi:tricorn protease